MTFALAFGTVPAVGRRPYSADVQALLDQFATDLNAGLNGLPVVSGFAAIANALGEVGWDYGAVRTNLDVFSKSENDAQYAAITRQVIAGTGLTGGGALSADRTLTLADTAVTPGTYGDGTHVGQFTVDQQGRITAASAISISAAGLVTSVNTRSGAVTGLAEDNAVVHLTGNETVAGVKTFSSAPVVPDASFTEAKVAGLTTDLIPVSVATLGRWNNVGNLALRAALANRMTTPAKVAIIADSEEEFVSAYTVLASELMMRYAGWEPHLPTAEYDGFTAPAGLFGWSGTGGSAVRGPTGEAMTLTAAQTAISLAQACSRVRLYYLPGVSQTFDVNIDGNTVATGVSTAARVVTPAIGVHDSSTRTGTDGTTATSLAFSTPTGSFRQSDVGRTITGTNIVAFVAGVTPATTIATVIDTTHVTLSQATTGNVSGSGTWSLSVQGPSQQITSTGLFNTNMVGSTITGTGIPAGARIIAVADTSHATISIACSTSGGGTTATITAAWWTSDALLFGSHVVTVTGNTGTTTLTGAHFYIGNYDAGVQIQGFGHSGWITADFVALSGGAATAHVATPQTDLQDHLALEQPDCVIFATAINDPDATTYNTQMGLLLTATRATLPNATFCLYTPEPVSAHSWMTGLPPVARALAVSHGTLHADGSTLIYDHSGQTGGIVDQPYQVSIDGIHYSSPVGGTLASSVILSALDLGPKRSEFWAISDQSGGLVAPYVRSTGGHSGVGYFSDPTQPIPSVWAGTIRGTAFNGLFAGNDGSGNPSYFLVAGANNGWFLNSGRVYGALDPPLLGSELISRAYTDKIAQRSVNCVATAILAATYSNGTLGVGATLTATSNVAFPAQDGITLTTTDGNNRILVGGQTSSFQNGIYKLTQQGTGSVPWILTRSTAFDEAAEMKAGVQVFVSAGTFFAGTQYYLAADVTTVGTDAVSLLNVNYGNTQIRLTNLFTIPILGFAPDATSGPDTYFSRIAAATMGFTGRLTGFANPSAADEVVPRSYLDAGYRRPVNCRTVSAVSATYANGTAGVGATLTGTGNGAFPAIDGVTLSTATGNNRVLVANQASTFQDGIYILTQLGDGSHPFILTRSDSFDEASEMVAGAGVFVRAGTVYGGVDFYLQTSVTTVGTDAVTFVAKGLGSSGVLGGQIVGATTFGLAAAGSQTLDFFWTRTAAAAAQLTGVQKFLSAPILNSLTGVVVANGSSALTASTTVAVAGGLTSSGTAGIGYATGAGGTVTQATSKSTAVTLNKTCGQITMSGAALTTVTAVAFTLTNSTIAATDAVIVSIASGATSGAYDIQVEAVAAGSCKIQVRNNTIGTLSEAIVLNYIVVKGVSS